MPRLWWYCSTCKAWYEIPPDAGGHLGPLSFGLVYALEEHPPKWTPGPNDPRALKILGYWDPAKVEWRPIRG